MDQKHFFDRLKVFRSGCLTQYQLRNTILKLCDRNRQAQFWKQTCFSTSN